MLGEGERLYVREVEVTVDPAVHRVRVGGGDLFDHTTERETDHDDRVVAGARECLEVRLAVVVGGRFEFLHDVAQLAGSLVGAAGCGVIEGAVAATAGVKGQTQLEVGALAGVGGFLGRSLGLLGDCLFFGCRLVVTTAGAGDQRKGSESERSGLESLVLSHCLDVSLSCGSSHTCCCWAKA